MSAFGGQSEFAPLRRVAVRAPDRWFGEADPAVWHYAGRPDLPRAVAEHAALVRLLEESGAEVIRHDTELAGLSDALYVYDPVLVTDRGAVVLRMGKALRRGEEDALAACLGAAGVPVAGRLAGEATAEAGDTLWLDPATLAVGIGFRTNPEAVRQLRGLLGPGVRVLPVELPYDQGPAACLHLKSFISLLDERLAVAHLPPMAVPFHQELVRRGIEVVEAPWGRATA
jgi:dimethylargininase